MMQLQSAVVGASVVVGLLAWAWWSRSHRWRRLATAYAVPAAPPTRAQRRFQTVVLRDPSGLWTAHQAGVHLGIAEHGLVLRPALPFGLGYPTLLLPHAELQLRPTSWYLVGGSGAIHLARSPVQVVLDGRQVEWLTAESGLLLR